MNGDLQGPADTRRAGAHGSQSTEAGAARLTVDEVEGPAGQAVGEPRERRSLAELLERLFATVRFSTDREFTYEQVATAIRAKGGPTISSVYVWQLRRGHRDNPTKRHIEALSGFFGVPPSYFFDERGEGSDDVGLRLRAALRNERLKRLVLEAAGLSDQALLALEDLVEAARRLEGRAGHAHPSAE